MKGIRHLLNVLLCGLLFLLTTSIHGQSIWTGTGFALNNGYIVTNWHVADGAQTIHIYGVQGDFTKKYLAEVVAKDKTNDLAILKVSGDGFSGFGTIPYKIRTNTANVAEEIFVLGYPMTSTLGNELKYTDGRISALSGYEGGVSNYQISAPVQPGNSGGPLFDNNGNVVGIVCAKIDNTVAQNVGYAVKTSYLKNLIETMHINNILPSNSQMDSYKERTAKVEAVRNFIFFIKCYDYNLPNDDAVNRPSYISVSPASLNISENREIRTLSVSSNAASWKVVSKPDWCDVSYETATYATIDVSKNNSSNSRSGFVVLETNDGKTANVYVSQSGKKPPYITANPTEIYADAKESQKEITVTTNYEPWEISSKPDWCKITNKSSTSFTVSFEKNDSDDSRTGIIMVENKTIATSISVLQYGKQNNGHEYVDLGLPSGLMWATCNLGADNPEDYGNYYAWGEFNPKSFYSEDNYAYPRNPAILPPNDDAAYINWGAGWRMPTKEDFMELVDNCVWAKTELNCHEGYKITGKNGNYIFLPLPYVHYHYWTSNLATTDYSSFSHPAGTAYAFYLDWENISYRRKVIEYSIANPDAKRYGDKYQDINKYRDIKMVLQGIEKEIFKDINVHYGIPVRPVCYIQKQTITQSLYESSNIKTDLKSLKCTYEGMQKDIKVTNISLVENIILPYWCSLINRTDSSVTINVEKNDSCENRSGVIVFESSDGKILSIPVSQSRCIAEHNGHEYVDLGLPSGTLWATCNVGACFPEAYGDKYVWGGITANSYYEKPFVPDKKDKAKRLPANADVATVKWGGNWRMPTMEDFNELLSECTWTYIRRVHGFVVTGKNGRCIFFPLLGSNYRIGSYWSCSLKKKLPVYLEIDEDGKNYMISNYNYVSGSSKFHVRPVCTIQE